MDNILNEIDNIKAKLDAAPIFTEGELERLREQFMVEYTYNSNAIEGNTLTLEETALVILEGLTINKKPLKCHLEAVGHKEAFDYIVEISNRHEILDEATIKDIHSLVLADRPKDRGKYRIVPVMILGSQDLPPHPIHVPTEMEKLLAAYAKDTRHPIIKIADLHILFERIHPFIDGNGRTGRLLMNLELIKAGYAPVNVKFQDREAYIDCFKHYEAMGNSDKFIEMVAKYELEELKAIYNLAAEKEATQKHFENIGEKSKTGNKMLLKPQKETPGELLARMAQKSAEIQKAVAPSTRSKDNGID